MTGFHSKVRTRNPLTVTDSETEGRLGVREGLLVIHSTGNLPVKMTESKLTLGFLYVEWVIVQSSHKSETVCCPREHIPRILKS